METGSLFLSLNFEGEVPSRIMLVPADKVIKGRDNREWKNPNPKMVALNSNARLPLLPVDENHSTDLAAPHGGASPAFGWMKNLCADETGAIWADVEWTERGREALNKKEYRFISPVFNHSEKGEINCILRAALTNAPNLNLPALNSERLENNVKESNQMKSILAFLGLPETATEAEALAAVSAMKTSLNAAQAKPQGVDLSVYAPRTDLVAMQGRAETAEKELASLNSAKLKAEGEAAVDQAIKDRKVAPASKAEYVALCSTQEGLDSFRKIMATTPAVFADASQVPAGTPPSTQTSLNAEEIAYAKSLGYSEEDWKKIKEVSK